MLFVLTGQIQTGKTRWLEGLVRTLSTEEIAAYGVIAPGVWADRRNSPDAYPHADANGFEKLGIDNVLLPTEERIAFARRADLALEEGAFDPQSQSAQAKLKWAISDDAIERVNAHFAELRAQAAMGNHQSEGLLIIDELGRLELLRGEGLTEAIAILQDGPSPMAHHALIIVREDLLPCLNGKFDCWGQLMLIEPDESSRALVLSELRANR